MNTFKKIIIVALLLKGPSLMAGLLSGSSLGWPLSNENETLNWNSTKFVKKTVIKNRSTFAVTKYNTTTVTQRKNITMCIYNKPAKATGIESVLKWDFKLKVKLNRNMNIIFSYN